MLPAVISTMGNWLYTYVLVLLLLAAGLYFTLRTRFVQVRLFEEAFRILREKSHGGGMSSFQALMISTASRVGTGNIAGVSIALCVGGVGAVFWMWVVALLGGASAFVESTLAQIYKVRDGHGGSRGGPAYYIRRGLGSRGLAAAFSVCLLATYLVGFNMVAAYNLMDAFSGYSFFSGEITPTVVGTILAAATAVCIFGGGRRLSKITGVLVPVMGGAYVLVSLLMILLHIRLLPGVIAAIFRSAFDFRAIFGGFTGSVMMHGIKRGLFSNEAGVGAAPNAAAAASVSHPVKQGLAQMLSVFLDTLVICTATAFLCLCSGVAPDPALKGVPYVQTALAGTFGAAGHWFITVTTVLFAFTTILGNYYYCESSFQYLLHRDARRLELTGFRILAALIVFQGARMDFSLVWDTADVTMGCMTLINLPAILLLAKPALLALEDYVRQKRRGRDPVFLAEDIGLRDKTEFWN